MYFSVINVGLGVHACTLQRTAFVKRLHDGWMGDGLSQGDKIESKKIAAVAGVSAHSPNHLLPMPALGALSG